MSNELQLNQKIDVKVQPAVVTTTGYDELLESVKRLKERIETVKVTEDNVQESKKLRAAVNKEIDKLKKSRTAVKRELLAAMDDLDSQIKEVTGLAADANGAIDAQIKELEEQARSEKYQKVTALFIKYSKQYDLPKLIADGLVDMFLAAHGQVLNKSVAMTKVESTIVDFLESVYKDTQAISVLPHAEPTLAEYSRNLDLPQAMKTVAERVAREKAAEIEKEVAPVVHKADAPQPESIYAGSDAPVQITVKETDLTAAIHALKSAGIPFSL